MPSAFGAALTDPWDALRAVVGEPLHPGGAEATADLLDRADVGAGTRLVDVGCGSGLATALARERGATALGVDHDPGGERPVRGDFAHLPLAASSVDVVLTECVLCLSEDLSVPLAEARRALPDGGRLALSDLVVEGAVPDLPDGVAEALCLTGTRDREHLLSSVEGAGFEIREVEDHQEDLLAMRDRAAERVDYEGLLGAMGERGQALLEGIERVEQAVEEGRIGYVSLVAE